MDVTIVIPTLDEEQNMAPLLDRVTAVMKERPESYEVVVADGGSTDRTRQIAEEYGCTVLEDVGGKGDALTAGINTADGDIVVTMDADLSHKPAELGMLIEGVRCGYDVCMGSRFIQGGGTNDMPMHRYLGNRVFVSMVNLLWGMRFSDLCYGYRSFRRDSFTDLDIVASGFDIEAELSIKAAKNGLQITEIPSFEKERMNGEPKLDTVSDGWRIFKTILMERFASGSG